jgi:hypothetical protein
LFVDGFRRSITHNGFAFRGADYSDGGMIGFSADDATLTDLVRYVNNIDPGGIRLGTPIPESAAADIACSPDFRSWRLRG